MDEHAREVFERAFQALDRVDAMQRTVLTDEQQNAIDDAWLAERQRQRVERSAPRGLVFKVNDNARVESAMTDADREWVMVQFEGFASMLGKAVAETQNEIIKKLRGEIEQLRGEVAQMKAAKPNIAAEGSVTSLRGRHVA